MQVVLQVKSLRCLQFLTNLLNHVNSSVIVTFGHSCNSNTRSFASVLSLFESVAPSRPDVKCGPPEGSSSRQCCHETPEVRHLLKLLEQSYVFFDNGTVGEAPTARNLY
jgi:hypothetical protein